MIFILVLGFILMGFCEVGMICLWLYRCGYMGVRYGDGCMVMVFGWVWWDCGGCLCSGGGVGELIKILGKLGVGMRVIVLFSWGFFILF